MNELIVVIATKNRSSFLELACESVIKQTYKPNEVIVVCDSLEDDDDHAICKRYGFTFLKDARTHNYAGNLNSAIDYIVKTRMIDSSKGIEGSFVAFLDDDDTWKADYLSKCWKAKKEDTDFVVSGLFYKTDLKEFPLSIPNHLDKSSFLSVNPHIQGSNTFIRMTTLLKAGCFDENMSSTTDRDIFTRIMMLNPRYVVINEHLVNVDAKDTRLRLTNTTEGKRKSLSQFFSKYGGLMSEEQKKAFFKRTERYSPITEKDVSAVLSCPIPNYFADEKEYESVDTTILFAFVASNEELGKRLIQGIKDLDWKKKRIIWIQNYVVESESCLLSSLLNDKGIDIVTVTLSDVRRLMDKRPFNEYVSDKSLKNGTIKDIAAARTILHFLAKQESKDGEVIWVLDDDMEFCEYHFESNNLIKSKLDVKAVIGRYYGTCDAIVGSYSNDGH